MIHVQLPAYMTCEEPECRAQQPVALFLLQSGGMAFKPPSQEWQVVMRRDGDAPFLTRCPLHKADQKLIQQAPAIPGLRKEH